MGISHSVIDTPIEVKQVEQVEKVEQVKEEISKVEEKIQESEVMVSQTKTPPTTPILEASQKVVEVFERYIEPRGTKIEVLPVEVAPSDDIKITK
jgi:hypothetical protein